MLKTIDLGNGKWGVKEYDDAGNSLGIKEEKFSTEKEADAFIDGVTPPTSAPKKTPEETPVNNTPSEPVDNDAEVAEKTESEKVPE